MSCAPDKHYSRIVDELPSAVDDAAAVMSEYKKRSGPLQVAIGREEGSEWQARFLSWTALKTKVFGRS